MYDRLPGLILGYHGCDKHVGEAVLAGKLHLKASNNSYDWLGHGIYFWDNNPARAVEWANFLQQHPQKGRRRINRPMAIGAVIDPGLCLNLMDGQFLSQLPKRMPNLRSLMRNWDNQCRKIGT